MVDEVPSNTVVIRGPVNARQLFHAEIFPNGQHLLHWMVGDQNTSERTEFTTVEFFPWHRRFSMTETEPLIYLTWELLMSKVAIILRPVEGPGDNAIQQVDREVAQHQARGIAEVLAIQMKPFMESADHVVKCAVKKYKDWQFEVPGLGAHLWNPMTNPDGTPRVALSTPKPAKTKPVARPKVDNTSTKKLTTEEAEGIKAAVDSGMFSKEDVAAMFKVSIATVEEAVG